MSTTQKDFFSSQKIKSKFLIGFLLLALALSHSHLPLVNMHYYFSPLWCWKWKSHKCSLSSNVWVSVMMIIYVPLMLMYFFRLLLFGYSRIYLYTLTIIYCFTDIFPFLSHLQVNFLAYHLWIKTTRDRQQRIKEGKGKATESQGHIATTKQTLSV